MYKFYIINHIKYNIEAVIIKPNDFNNNL